MHVESGFFPFSFPFPTTYPFSQFVWRERKKNKTVNFSLFSWKSTQFLFNFSSFRQISTVWVLSTVIWISNREMKMGICLFGKMLWRPKSPAQPIHWNFSGRDELILVKNTPKTIWHSDFWHSISFAITSPSSSHLCRNHNYFIRIAISYRFEKEMQPQNVIVLFFLYKQFHIFILTLRKKTTKLNKIFNVKIKI